MKQTQIIMGMPITIEICDSQVKQSDFDTAFAYFHHVDEKFSTYKDTSEISKINRGELSPAQYSDEMKEVFQLSEKTKQETDGFFDIRTPKGIYDPSGLVKGWSIYNTAKILQDLGLQYFFIDAGGDIQAMGNRGWTVGIKNPFNQAEIVKVLKIVNQGVATSGTYIRGQHIYNPHAEGPLQEVVSLTVIGPDIYQADRFATAAFAMGRKGIEFIEKMAGFEGYQIDKSGQALYTSGFNKYVVDGNVEIN